jgi:hypothetical protein
MYRKNTESQSIYFAMINASTGAALTGATVTARRALDATAQATATGTVTELGNGQYRFNLSQADTNANYGSYLFTATSAVPVEKTVVFTAVDPTNSDTFGIGKLSLITSGNVTYTSPVSPSGAIKGTIVIGDDYLAVNARAFEWTISARAGYVVGTSTCRFGGSNAELGKSWLVTGTVSDPGGGEWNLSFDLNKTVTADLLEGYYRWSVELVSAGGTEVTEVYSGRNVEVRAKQT